MDCTISGVFYNKAIYVAILYFSLGLYKTILYKVVHWIMQSIDEIREILKICQKKIGYCLFKCVIMRITSDVIKIFTISCQIITISSIII